MTDDKKVENEGTDDGGAVPLPEHPSLLRNYISFVGIAIVAASLTSIILLFLIELTSSVENAYMGILTYIILPAGMLFGIALMIIGALIERRQRRKEKPHVIMAYPKLDLNDPRSRRRFLAFLIVTFIFISASAFGSYRAFEYTESVAFCGEACHSVMKPEHTAYLAGAHARVRCVDCHVGSGADWYVRSKLSGAYQLYSVAFKKYSKPIGTPVHNLRPAPETCEQCHWPEKFFGAQMKVFRRYGFDEQNSLRERRMLINVGGGSPNAGQVTGIHWHMNIANEVTYIATDERRQVIPWVHIKDRFGNETEYEYRFKPLAAEDVASMPRRKMDCVDCHNRPAHNYLSPDVAIDDAFTAGRLDTSLPYLKRQAVEVLSAQYETTEQAVKAIDSGLTEFYATQYPEIFKERGASIRSAIEEIKQIFQTYSFPEMKTDWQTHPNNIGHLHTTGCFRCHDGQHVSKTGKVISNDCNVCHTVIFDSGGPPEKNIVPTTFTHPVDLGALADRKCASCHVSTRPFKHPINLGDISMFQCSTCHPK